MKSNRPYLFLVIEQDVKQEKIQLIRTICSSLQPTSIKITDEFLFVITDFVADIIKGIKEEQKKS
jgi:hypothetical protein